MNDPEIRVDDIVRLRKPHPCGATDWVVVRIGADIGLRCLGCGRRVLLPRPYFRRRLKAIIGHISPATEAESSHPS